MAGTRPGDCNLLLLLLQVGLLLLGTVVAVERDGSIRSARGDVLLVTAHSQGPNLRGVTSSITPEINKRGIFKYLRRFIEINYIAKSS